MSVLSSHSLPVFLLDMKDRSEIEIERHLSALHSTCYGLWEGVRCHSNSAMRAVPSGTSPSPIWLVFWDMPWILFYFESFPFLCDTGLIRGSWEQGSFLLSSPLHSSSDTCVRNWCWQSRSSCVTLGSILDLKLSGVRLFREGCFGSTCMLRAEKRKVSWREKFAKNRGMGGISYYLSTYCSRITDHHVVTTTLQLRNSLS